MTKKELLAVAKTYQISGRHDMTLAELQQAVNAFEAQQTSAGEAQQTSAGEAQQTSAGEAQQTVSKEALKNVTRRYPSLLKRDENGRILRAGKNLSGNSPFRHKYYYLNPNLADETRWTPAYKEAFDAAPAQVKGLIRYMAKYVCDKNVPEIGGKIARGAIAQGYVVSRIDPDKLAAYYRKALEVLGMIHAVGYDPDSEESEGGED